jgi:signal transduction histidine kinase
VLIEQLQTEPLETTGLREALKRQCEALAFRTGADVQVVVGDLPPDMWLPPGAQRALFRGAQEALANVGRHARARHVQVRLGTEGDQLELLVADDGAGFEPGKARAGMGLENMHERARAMGGSFLLTSSPGEGTTARFIVPLRHRSMREYAAQALLFLAALTLNLVLGDPFRFPAVVVSAVAAVALIQCIVAIVKLRRAGATWR